jgi:hypothetical protein
MIQIKHPGLWSLGIGYAILTPAAFFIPVNIFDIAPWTRAFTDAVAWAVPMINRVVTYGNPYPDKLRFFLAIAWVLVPVIFVILWKYCLQWTQKARKKRGVGATVILAIPFFCLAYFVVWYWPSFDFLGPAFHDSLYSRWDSRRKLFFDDLQLSIWTPLWLTGSTAILGQLVAEVLLLIRPSKVDA